MFKLTKHHKLKFLTNQITYNKLLRSTKEILNESVFDFNDDNLRTQLTFKLNNLYKKAYHLGAITGYDITISDFNPAKPHYLEIEIVVSFPNMVEHVIINFINDNS